MTRNQDERYMRAALNLARQGLGRTAPNPSVGCIIVKDGVIVAAVRTDDGGRPHAETRAIAQAGEHSKGACAYVTLEPCAHVGETPSCARALADCGISRVVVACRDPDPRTRGQGVDILRHHGVEVVEGVLEDDAAALNSGFIKVITQKHPYITQKLAVSRDGKIAAQKGQRTAISGKQANLHTHMMRASHDAILVGVATVLSDDPQLTVRLPGYEDSIIRIILDSELNTPVDAKLFHNIASDPVWVCYAHDPHGRKAALEKAGAKLFNVNPHHWDDVLTLLASHGITRLLVEGGAKIHTTLLKSGFGNDFVITRSEIEFGDAGVNALAGHDMNELNKNFGFDLKAEMAAGKDSIEFWEKKECLPD